MAGVSQLLAEGGGRGGTGPLLSPVVEKRSESKPVL